MLNSFGLFSNCEGHGLDPYWASTEMLGNASQDALVHLVQAIGINFQHFQRTVDDLD